MKNKRNFYRILHVQPDAPVELIRMSYRTIMQKLKKHPDLGGDEWDAAVINEAYSVLCDPKMRAVYDERLLRERTMADTAEQSKSQRAGFEESSSPGADEQSDASEKADQGADTSRDENTHTEEPANNGSEQPSQSANDGATNAGPACLFCAKPYVGNISEQSDCLACASPLQLLDATVMESEGKRGIQRQPNYCPLEVYAFWPGEKQAAVLADLSLNGLQFRFPVALQAGHLVKIECQLFSAVAKVAHCASADAGFLLGAQFLSLRFTAQQGSFVSTSA
ncbi:MAG: DnaJ domain-containing protein [Pseudomonadales bacterium]